MSLADDGRAVEAFLAVIAEGQGIAKAGKVGAEFDELLRHAKELLDLVDEELLELDRDEHAELFAAAPVLRQELESGCAMSWVEVWRIRLLACRPAGWNSALLRLTQTIQTVPARFDDQSRSE